MTILIADPDEARRDALKIHFLQDFSLVLVDSLVVAASVLRSKSPIAVAFLSVDGDPSEKTLIKEISQHNTAIKIIAMAERHAEDAGIKAVKNGASGYVIKPLAAEQARALVG